MSHERSRRHLKILREAREQTGQQQVRPKSEQPCQVRAVRLVAHRGQGVQRVAVGAKRCFRFGRA